MTSIRANTGVPTMRVTRPTVSQASPFTLSDAEFYAWLSAQGSRYRSDSIYLEAASLVEHHCDEPIVAGRTLCAAPSVDLGATKPSPNALIRDRWHNLKVTATQTKSFTSGSPSGTLTVSALSLALPAGFVIGLPNQQGFLQLTVNAALGATTISVQRIYTDVSISSSDILYPNNGYFYQRGCGAPVVRNVALVGDPNPRMNPGFETSRKYACDGIAIQAMGSLVENVLVDNMPGHGVWISSPAATSTLGGAALIWDQWEPVLGGRICARSCLSGITLGATDAVYNDLTAVGCRDYGVRITGFYTQGKSIHAYGCGVGVSLDGGTLAGSVESENCNFGINLFAASQIGGMLIYDNRYRGLVVETYSANIGSIYIRHGNSETIADGYPTGWAMVVKGFSNRFVCPALDINARAGSKGFLLGEFGNGHVLEDIRIGGLVVGYESPGSRGLEIGQHVKGSGIDLGLNGFANCLYINDGITMSGSTVHIRGTSTNTIRWPGDDTPRTFTDPHIPVAYTDVIQFHVY